jgi:TupA-like ATPgrasp
VIWWLKEGLATTSPRSVRRLKLLDLLSRILGTRRLYLARFVLLHHRWPQLHAQAAIMDKIAARILAGGFSARRRDLTDKLLCREIVAEACPRLRQKQVLAVYSKPAELCLADLPDAFVLKPNHASGLNLLVFDKRQVSERELRKTVAWWLNFDYYTVSQEPCYRGIVPQVFAEELLTSTDMLPPAELQLFCIHGRVEFMEYQGLTLDGKENPFYDREWHLLEVRYPGHAETRIIEQPIALDDAILAAEKIAAGLDFLRVDILVMPDGTLTFGETASSPWAGLFRLEPDGAEQLLGEYWQPYSAEEEMYCAIRDQETVAS